jgi:hypothetical protein
MVPFISVSYKIWTVTPLFVTLLLFGILNCPGLIYLAYSAGWGQQLTWTSASQSQETSVLCPVAYFVEQ